MRLNELVTLADKLENYGFECEGGPLKNCMDWQAFRDALIKHTHLSQTGTDTCGRCFHDIRHSVHAPKVPV